MQHTNLALLALPRDEAVQACRDNAGRLAQLNRFDVTGRDQFIELGASDADHARGIVDLHADRLDRS